MQIALVFPPFYFEPMYNMVPLGLVNLATVLKPGGHHAVLFDFPLAIRRKTLKMGKLIYDDCAEQILAANPDLAAFSVQCTTYPPALQIAEKLKAKKPEIRIVFGGHNASFVDERTLTRFPYLDAIVRGEGEVTFPELVSAYATGQELRAVRGITFRDGESIFRNADRELIEDLDTLPLADYTLAPALSEYRDACGIPRSIAILEVGRGCPHECIYCSQSLVWRRRARTFSVDRIIAEMRNLADNFGAECFLLAYDQFTARRDYAEELCRKVIDSGLHRIPWYCISRMDTADAAMLKLMREAGCESLCYGIDSGSSRTLAFIRKKIDRKILHRRVVETTEQGIVPTLSFVIGFPEETKEDLNQTLELALQAGAAGAANILVQMATILPGTDLHARYSDRLVREVDTYFSFGIEFDSGKRLDTDVRLIESDPHLFSSFYNLPCPAGPLRELNLIASHFSLIATFYPRSFLFLAQELNEPLSDLFLRFLARLSQKLDRKEPSLSPRDCFAHFPDFACELFGNRPLLREFLPDLLRYETAAIEAGKFEASGATFTIDLNGIERFRPAANRKIKVEEFTFDIPGIILDTKQGIFRNIYANRRTFLIFRQVGGQLDVKEINEFGADFIRLCDGRRALADIADELYPRYGQSVNRPDFGRFCSEAVQTLGELGLIIPEQQG